MCRTYRQLFLQAVVEVFGLVGLQLLQRDSGFADELIVAEFILVAHRDPVDSGREGAESRDDRQRFSSRQLQLEPVTF